MQTINNTIKAGGYFLVVEGSIPAGMPKACVVGHETITDQVARASKNAIAVIAAGSCASFGGIPAAEGNPTGAISVGDFLKQKGVDKPVVNLPGCPTHPDWIVSSVVHIIKFGLPALDSKGRPKQFFNQTVHDQCPRFADYEREFFAKTFGDNGCLFKLGCMGPNTLADCSLRKWNSGTNTCIQSGAPCIGCSWEEFTAKKNFPFHRKTEMQLRIKKD